MKYNTWKTRFENKDMCSLCGQLGYIDTRGLKTPAGTEVGRLNFCLCPNGNAINLAFRGDIQHLNNSNLNPSTFSEEKQILQIITNSYHQNCLVNIHYLKNRCSLSQEKIELILCSLISANKITIVYKSTSPYNLTFVPITH